MFKFKNWAKVFLTAGLIFSTGIISGCGSDSASNSVKKEFLNVSYDPPRELYAAYNEKFHEHWVKELGKDDVILTS